MRFLFYFTLFFTFSFAQFDWQDDGASIRQGLHIEWQKTGDKWKIRFRFKVKNLEEKDKIIEILNEFGSNLPK